MEAVEAGAVTTPHAEKAEKPKKAKKEAVVQSYDFPVARRLSEVADDLGGGLGKAAASLWVIQGIPGLYSFEANLSKAELAVAGTSQNKVGQYAVGDRMAVARFSRAEAFEAIVAKAVAGGF